MIPVPTPLDKYDTRARPVPLRVSMGTHGLLNLYIFFYK